jgi:hypothetical protein
MSEKAELTDIIIALNCDRLVDQIERTQKLHDLCLDFRRLEHLIKNPDSSKEYTSVYSQYSKSEIADFQAVQRRSLLRRIGEIAQSIGFIFEPSAKLFSKNGDLK